MTFERREIGDCVLYRGDNLEVLPTLSGIDAVLTDPPFGTGWSRGGLGVGEFEGQHEQPAWDRWDSRWATLVTAKRWAVFMPHHRIPDFAAIFPKFGMRYWVKTNPRPGLRGCDAPSVEPIFIVPHVANSTTGQHLECYNGDTKYHPCQKPLDVILWLLAGISGEGQVVLDPFMGSGTTAVACIRAGRQFIGIEQDVAHFNTACQRIADAWRAERSRLPMPIPPQVIQPALFDT
jgi:hypothetical protein